MVFTYKNRFNKKYGFPLETSHSIASISKLTGYKKSGLDVIYDKGVGAFYTNRKSVRPHIKSPQQWAMARIYSAVMGGLTARIDASHLIKE